MARRTKEVAEALKTLEAQVLDAMQNGGGADNPSASKFRCLLDYIGQLEAKVPAKKIQVKMAIVMELEFDAGVERPGAWSYADVVREYLADIDFGSHMELFDPDCPIAYKGHTVDILDEG